MRIIKPSAITKEAFGPFGEILEARGEPDKIINQGLCGRYHDLASLDFSDGRAGVSIFMAAPRSLPHKLDMVERHPLGSQTFIPMHQWGFLVIVAEDAGGVPRMPRAFITSPGQGISLRRGVWHGVLTPLHEPGLFAVVDRIGDGDNLEEHWFPTQYMVEPP